MSKSQEKAEELRDKYLNVRWDIGTGYAKLCAIIAQKNLLDKLASLNIKDEFEEAVLFEINVL